MNVLEIRKLTKEYPGFKLEGLDLTLPGGCIMGLIGENGAGKSTAIKLILGILRQNSGTVTVLGQSNAGDMRAVKEDIGVVFDEVGLLPSLTARQMGRVMACTYKKWDAAEFSRLLKELDIPEEKPFKDFSRGMKMKLGIAIALSHDAKLLLLDEPTSGLDPVARDQVVELFRDFVSDDEHSVLISSHIVSDLEKLCDYVAFLHKGRLLICEEKDLLLSEYGVVHCTAEQFRQLAPEAVRHAKHSPYGVEAIIRRDAVKSGMSVSPVSIEELFVHMVKEAE